MKSGRAVQAREIRRAGEQISLPERARRKEQTGVIAEAVITTIGAEQVGRDRMICPDPKGVGAQRRLIEGPETTRQEPREDPRGQGRSSQAGFAPIGLPPGSRTAS